MSSSPSEGITVAYADRVASGSRTDVSRLLLREHQYAQIIAGRDAGVDRRRRIWHGLERICADCQGPPELATLAIVMALPNQHPAVRQHLKVCRRLGWTRKELTEVLIQLTGYIGWPLVLPLTRIALDVFAQPTKTILPVSRP